MGLVRCGRVVLNLKCFFTGSVISGLGLYIIDFASASNVAKVHVKCFDI